MEICYFLFLKPKINGPAYKLFPKQFPICIWMYEEECMNGNEEDNEAMKEYYIIIFKKTNSLMSEYFKVEITTYLDIY